MPATTPPTRTPHLRSHRRRAGMTLVEATIAILLVSLVIVGALQTVGSAATTRMRNAQRDRAVLLAEGLMAEIVAKAYIDPQSPTTTAMGVDAGESATNRSTFDDVDDYHGWTQTPPTDASGNAIAGMTGYTRSVEVVWVSLAAPGTTAASDSGLKRIRITVKRRGGTLFTLTSYRSKTAGTLSES